MTSKPDWFFACESNPIFCIEFAINPIPPPAGADVEFIFPVKPAARRIGFKLESPLTTLPVQANPKFLISTLATGFLSVIFVFTPV